jgi:hypothetical protein
MAVMTESVIAIAQYRVKPGAEEQFTDVLRQHTSTLRSLGLITDRPVEVFLGEEKKIDGPLFVEIFEWVSTDASSEAHTHPQVTQLWETMSQLCESRGGRPMFEFPNVRALAL